MKRLILTIGLLSLWISSLPGCEENITLNLPREFVEGIQVTGTGSVLADPDVAILNMGVSVERRSVKEAADEAAEAMEKVISSLKGRGVADEDIQTQNFSIQPQYDYVDGKQILRGYKVINTLRVKIRDLSSVGEIIDEVVIAGGNSLRVNSILFSIDDPGKAHEEARVKAMEDARRKAEILARESGVKLGRPIS
ncbi:TPA: DUF541 domain-containing protein, partial [Candidatus Poribacteria bacterium]|nr:DUF541 domain-containing protein [Candidatus Poribacteria bacterium]